MTSPGDIQLLSLLQTIAPAAFFEELTGSTEVRSRQGIYTTAVVVWLMILQRLHPKGTLAAAVHTLAANTHLPVLTPCKRIRESRVSPHTGGYCQARLKLPKLVAIHLADHIVQKLQTEIQAGWPGLQRPVFLIDGSSLQLKHEKGMLMAFPPTPNQHGASHWPVMRIVVFHDVFSGLALRPSWGPMFGKHAVSEQKLAGQSIERLPSHAVVMADRNFGIFSMAYAVQQSKRCMVFRLTEARARKISPEALWDGADQEVIWTVSRWERSAHPEVPIDAEVKGRLIVCRNPSNAEELLYLFTTVDLAAAEVLALYKLRWNIETDLRSLKQTVRLHQLSSKSVDMMEKELLLAVSAYNLVRAVMCLAARQAEISPRQLSFSHVQDAVHAFLPKLTTATSDQQYAEQVDRLLRTAAQCKLPNRSHPRSYPRKIWGRGGSFPTRRAVKTKQTGKTK
jgi:hypothetical protein